MNPPGIGLKVRTIQWSTGNRLFIETWIVNRAVGNFYLPNDVRQGNAVDTRNGGEVVGECGFPLRPLALVFELPGVSCLADGIGLILFDLPDISTLVRHIEGDLKSFGTINSFDCWVFVDADEVLHPMD